MPQRRAVFPENPQNPCFGAATSRRGAARRPQDNQPDAGTVGTAVPYRLTGVGLTKSSGRVQASVLVSPSSPGLHNCPVVRGGFETGGRGWTVVDRHGRLRQPDWRQDCPCPGILLLLDPHRPNLCRSQSPRMAPYPLDVQKSPQALGGGSRPAPAFRTAGMARQACAAGRRRRKSGRDGRL
jgi:hypothetical protein